MPPRRGGGACRTAGGCGTAGRKAGGHRAARRRHHIVPYRRGMRHGTVPPTGGTIQGRPAGGCGLRSRKAAPRSRPPKGGGSFPRSGNRRPEGAAALHQNSRTYGSVGGGAWGFFPWVAALWGKPAHRGLGAFMGHGGTRACNLARPMGALTMESGCLWGLGLHGKWGVPKNSLLIDYSGRLGRAPEAYGGTVGSLALSHVWGRTNVWEVDVSVWTPTGCRKPLAVGMGRKSGVLGKGRRLWGPHGVGERSGLAFPGMGHGVPWPAMREPVAAIRKARPRPASTSPWPVPFRPPRCPGMTL